MRPYQRDVELPRRIPMLEEGTLLRQVGEVRAELRDLDRLGPPDHEDDPEEFSRKG